MIYVTGDTHGHLDISKLNTENFPEQKLLTKSDYVIITGDFGCIWDNSEQEKQLRKDLENRNFTTLFLDGNHENYTLLNSYPIEEWNGGLIHRISNSIIHLMRGQVFTIENNKFFIFGGAESTDKIYRIEDISWWKEELASDEEMRTGLYNLKKHNNKVNYILTHTCSKSTLDYMAKQESCIIEEYDPTVKYLEDIKSTAEYDKWIFGHYHIDVEINDKETAIYNKIIKLT